ncbi:hypothetical protein PSZ89_22775, partial [Shigella sonnei]|nr:hypothetical protein [Shigella sonnei]
FLLFQHIALGNFQHNLEMVCGQGSKEKLLPLGRALDRVLTWNYYMLPCTTLAACNNSTLIRDPVLGHTGEIFLYCRAGKERKN